MKLGFLSALVEVRGCRWSALVTARAATVIHVVGWPDEAECSLGWCQGVGERGWGEAGSGVVEGEGGSLLVDLPGKLELHCDSLRRVSGS